MNTAKHIVFWSEDTNERCYSKALDGLDSTAKSSCKLSLLKNLQFCFVSFKCQVSAATNENLWHENKLPARYTIVSVDESHRKLKVVISKYL